MENLILLAADEKKPNELGYVWALFGINLDTIIFSLINLLLIILAYRFFLHKPVMEMLEKRKKAVDSELAEAAESKSKALAAEKEYNALISDSKAQASKIVNEAMAKAHKREEEIITEAKNTALQIRQKADEEIERERKRAVNEIKDQIAEIVIMAAGAVAEKEISVDDNAALIESFLAQTNA